MQLAFNTDSTGQSMYYMLAVVSITCLDETNFIFTVVVSSESFSVQCISILNWLVL